MIHILPGFPKCCDKSMIPAGACWACCYCGGVLWKADLLKYTPPYVPRQRSIPRNRGRRRVTRDDKRLKQNQRKWRRWEKKEARK